MVNIKNNNITKIEELRDEEEVKSYFKSKGINLTNKELIKLKECFNNLEREEKNLTHQQLNEVAGGGPGEVKILSAEHPNAGPAHNHLRVEQIILHSSPIPGHEHLVHTNQDARQMEDETAVVEHNLPSEVRQGVLRQHPGDPSNLDSTTVNQTQIPLTDPFSLIRPTQKAAPSVGLIREEIRPETMNFYARINYIEQQVREPAHKSRRRTADDRTHANIQATSVSEVQTEESRYEDRRDPLITINSVPSKESQKSNSSIVSSGDKSTISETISSSGNEKSTADAAFRDHIHTPTETTPTVLSKHPAEILRKLIEQSHPKPGTPEIVGPEVRSSDISTTASLSQLPSESTIRELFTDEGLFINRGNAIAFNDAIIAKLINPKTKEPIVDPETRKPKSDLNIGDKITLKERLPGYTFEYNGWVREHDHNYYRQFTVTWEKEGKEETRTISIVIPQGQRTNVIQRLDNIVGGIFEEGKEALKKPVAIALNDAISAQLVDLKKGDKITLKERLPGYTFEYNGWYTIGTSYYRQFTVKWLNGGKEETSTIRIAIPKDQKTNVIKCQGNRIVLPAKSTAKAVAEEYPGCNMQPNKRQKIDASADFSTCDSSPTRKLPHHHNIPAVVLEPLGEQTLINEVQVDPTEALTRSAAMSTSHPQLPSKSTISKLFTDEGLFINKGNAIAFNRAISKKLIDPKTGESRDDLSIGERIECFGYEFKYEGKYHNKKMGKNCRKFTISYSEDGKLKSKEIHIRIPDKKIANDMKVAALSGNKMEDDEAVAPEAIVDDEGPAIPTEPLTSSTETATIPFVETEQSKPQPENPEEVVPEAMEDDEYEK